MLAKSIFVNKFQKGSQENPNIGYGAIVGIDTYTKKGVAMLAKKSETILASGTAGVSDNTYPHFFAVSSLGQTWWAQFNNGDVFYSTDSGVTWGTTSFPATGTNFGSGLIFFQNYMFAFIPTKIYYVSSSSPTAGWVDWTTTKSLTALTATTTSPIVNMHFPLLYPSQRGVYFGNANAAGTVGFFGQNGTTTFNPAGVTGTDFLYNGAALSLPSNTYAIESLNFLPPSNLAIAVKAFQEPDGADLITWDTITNNKFNPPLRIYSSTQGFNNQGIKQMLNRNQVLYAIAGGNHAIFETNGSNFNLVDDVSLYSNIRDNDGAETTLPVFFNSYPQARCMLGNKMLTGVSTPANPSYVPSNKGVFPIGVWSLAFNTDGTKSLQCEFPLPVGNLTSYGTAGSSAKITALLPVGNNEFLVGYYTEDVATGDIESGIAMVDTTTFIDDITKTAIESPLWEIGTALNPQAINNIEILLAKPLLTGQTIDIAYRTSLSEDWTTLDTFTGDGTKDNYKVTKNPIGAVRYLQLRVRMATGSGGQNTDDSPYLRNVIVS